jgi:triosephosphate isomerase
MKIIAGNWKMNGSMAAWATMLAALSNLKTENTIIICPPYTLLANAKTNIAIGAQDISEFDSGAYTGEVSGKMIAETGATYVIVGHSERRQYHGETSGLIARKAAAARKNGLTPIVCVGETKDDYESGRTLEIIEDQVRNSIPTSGDEFIVAYEPVWAIGTGLIPTLDDIRSVHNHIAKVLDDAGFAGTAILYGGSVKGSNAADIMGTENVDGVLVGGASLKPDDFIPIITAC